jgi:hypothetical protein
MLSKATAAARGAPCGHRCRRSRSSRLDLRKLLEVRVSTALAKLVSTNHNRLSRPDCRPIGTKPAKVKEATAAGICLCRFTAACGLWSIDFRKGSLDEQVSRSDRTAFRTTDGVGACAERQGRERALALHMRVRNEERNSGQRFDIW